MANSWEDLPDLPEKAEKESWEDLPDLVEKPVKQNGVYRVSVLGRNESAPDDLPEPESKTSMADAAKGGLAQGLSLGFSDELEGGLNAGLRALGVKINDNDDLLKGVSLEKPTLDWDTIKKAYTDSRDARREKLHAVKEEHPVVYTASEVAGSLPLPVGGLGGAKTALSAAKAAAQSGALLGIGSAIGNHEGKQGELAMPSAGELVVAGGTGALLGGAFGAGGQKVGNYLAKKAEEKALKAVLPPAGITNRLKKEGLAKIEDQRVLGRRLLDEGAVPWSGSKQTALERIESKLDDAGNRIGKHLEEADTLVPGRMDYQEMGAAARSGLPKDNAVAQLSQGKGVELAKALEEQGKLTPGSFQGAWNAKKAAQKSLNFSDQAPEAQKIAKDVERAARQNIMEQLERTFQEKALSDLGSDSVAGGMGKWLGEAAPESGLGKQAAAKMADMREQLYRYGDLASAQNLAEEALGREGSHSLLGMTGGQILGGGIATANPKAIAMSLLAGMGQQGMKHRAWGPVARSADLMSKVAKKTDPLLRFLTPVSIPAAAGASNAWQRWFGDDEKE